MEKIGLEAILNMGNFNKGMTQYTKGITGMEKSTSTAATGLKTFDDKMGMLSGGLTSLIPGVVGATAAFYGLGKVMEFGKEGAAVAQTQESFDRLMNSMGIAPDILQRMRDATLGTVDDMTLMSSTMTLLAGTGDDLGRAMTDAAPQLLNIAKAANKLNPTLGDTASLYQSLATGIKRSSPLILDNLGLTIKVGEANQRYADKMGIVLENMTAEDRQMALLEETLRAGDRMIEQVGGNTEAAGDDFAYAETQLKNLTNTLKADAYPIIADIVGVVGDLVGGLNDLYQALEKLPGGVNLLYGGLTALSKAKREAKSAADDLGESTDNLADSEETVTYYTKELSDAQHEAEITTEGLESAQKKLEKVIQDIQKAYEKTFSELSKGIIKQRDLGRAAEESAADYKKALQDLNKSAAKSLGDVQENFEASLPNRTTVEDRMGMAGDAWDEWGLRLQDIIENGVASPWYATLQEMGYAKPPDVGISGWAQDLQDEFYAGRLPDLLPEDWAEKVRQQQQEATAAVRQETANRRAALEEARQAELAAEKEARDQATLELALSIAEQTGLLQAWSLQRFGPDFSQIADSADEVMGLLESGMLDIDGALQEIITNSVAGVQTALDTTGQQAAETKDLLDEVLSTDWGEERRGTMAMIGQVIDDEITDATPFEIMLRNFEGATQGIITSATLMGLDLDTTFGEIDSEWAATVQSQVETWDEGMTEVEKAIQEKVIEKLQEIPSKIVVTVTTEQEGGEGKQHGGPVQTGVPYVVGESGPEMFVPDQPGTIIPNWAMNLPAITGAGATGGGVVGPTVNITMNPTINSKMDLAEFEMLTERTVQRAIRGI